jgi:hypothetical protein
MEASDMSVVKRTPSGYSLPFALLALAALSAPTAWAGRTSIDFTGPDSFGASTGLSMPLYTPGCASDALNGAVDTTCSLNLTGNGSAEIALGFNVTIGANNYGTLFINENGFVTFGSAASATAQNSSTFAGLQSALGTTPFIAPAVADFTTGSSTPFDFSSGGAGVYYQRGLGVLGNGPYFDNDPRATEAFNVIWLSYVGSERFVSQLVLYSLDAGGFAAQFNYGSQFGDPNPTLAGGFGGYSLDGLTASFGNGFDDTLAAYRFAGGVEPPPTGVPEPGTLALMLAGLLGLALTTRRRRVATASGPALPA